MPKKEEKEIVLKSRFDPATDTSRAKKAADKLVDMVRQNHWSVKVGQGEHLMYEAWQTLGKYYEMSVETLDSEPIEIAGIPGFKAKAQVIDDKTGIKIGGAEAYCMRDEANWRNKPVFQLASMAQTRAGSKALRQILGFVVALAGYNPTPAEEMIVIEPPKVEKITLLQQEEINGLLEEKGKTFEDLEGAVKIFGISDPSKLTKPQADKIITKLKSLPIPDIDIDEVDEAINTQ